MTLIKNDITYLTTEEACTTLGVSRQTINNLVKQKSLHQYKMGFTRTVYYRQSEVEALTDIHPVDREDTNE
jgi:excisionase family DNA binding protein